MPEWAYIPAGIGALACLLLLIQDLRGRWVHLLPLAVLFAAGLVFRGLWAGNAMWLEFAVNAGFVTVVVVLVGLVFRLKGGGGFINKKLGLGDVLMLYAVATWLDPPGFALFYVSSLLLILLGMLILMNRKSYNKEYPIPLAGLMAAYLLVYAPLYWYFAPYIHEALMWNA